MRDTYAPIEAHGVIGDLHTAVLVAADGAIDWACLPRFDSDSLFGAVLDAKRGGLWCIAPAEPATSEQRYLPGTNVLQTSFRDHGGGVVIVTDFMPVGPARSGRSRIARRASVVRGAVPVRVTFAPRFDYALRMPRLVQRMHGIQATDADNDAAALSGPPAAPWQLADGIATLDLWLGEGEHVWFVLAFDEDEVAPVADHGPDRLLEDTTTWWDSWSRQLQYEGPYRREVERSALALKLCCHEPSGAIVAAATTSLPESWAGGRNWDYRYTWLRDSAFVLFALHMLGYHDETDAFLGFLKRVCRRHDGGPLQIMFAVDGRRELPERVLDHLEGYRGLGPVRIGNGAAGQFQLDIYGEVLATIEVWGRGRELSEGLWQVARDLVNWTADHWREPDWSIWEPRTEPKQHVFSKVMAWVALDRGARLAERGGHTEDVQRWRNEAALVHAEVLERGWDPVRGTFVQVYGEQQLDAALLVIPKVNFLSRGDPRVASTLAAVRRELATPCEDLVYRYLAPDGLDGAEGAFIICSFWMIQNLAMTGSMDEAERLFRNLVRRGGELGLFAEEIDPLTGAQQGNYPQALSHAGLINTALILERLRGRIRSDPEEAIHL
jgi:GH15 family glucan-1,4-alpha-glucosidase